MKQPTFNDYLAAVKQQYEQQSSKYASMLLQASPAQLRDLCLMIFEDGLNKQDELIFRVFFKAKGDDNLRKYIEDYHLPNFRRVQKFLNNESESTGKITLNLIAVLVDFQPRPLAKFLREWDNEEPLEKQPDESIIESVSAPAISTGNSSSKGDVIPVPETKERNNKLRIIAVAFFILFFGYMIKVNFFPARDCAQWNENHYEKVVCKGNLIGAPENVFIRWKDEYSYFKKIEVCDTTTFFKNGKPNVWYSKFNGKPDFFNMPENHPITGKQLSPVTTYIINAHVIGKLPCR